MCDVERNKLRELTQVLKGQLSEAQSRAAEAESRARQLERQQSGKERHAGGSQPDLEDKLLVQQDEIEALKQILEDTRSAKDEEVALLQKMMNEMRRVFSDGLKAYKK